MDGAVEQEDAGRGQYEHEIVKGQVVTEIDEANSLPRGIAVSPFSPPVIGACTQKK